MNTTTLFRQSSREPRTRTARGRTGPAPASLALLTALAALLAAPAASEGQFSVRPVIHHYPAGSSATHELTVHNEADAGRQIEIYVADFDRDRTGDHRFLDAGEHERSCAGRIEVFPGQLRLGPDEAGDVRVTVEPGPRTCWSVVFAETVEGDREGVRVGRRIGAKVFGHGHGAQQDVSVDSVRASAGDDSVDVRFTVENTGEVPVRPEGSVEVRTVTGEVVGRRELRPFGVLPGRSRDLRVTVPARLEDDRHLAVPILDTGADHLIGGQASVKTSGSGPSAGER